LNLSLRDILAEGVGHWLSKAKDFREYVWGDICITLAQQYSDDDKVRELLESLLWPHGAYCPHCKADMP
jgi:hypothetical protein